MTLLNGILLALAIICLLVAMGFLIRAFGARNQVRAAAYNVGRQELRHDMQVDLVRGAAFLLVSLTVWAVFGLSLRPGRADANITATTTATLPSIATSTVTAAPTVTQTQTPAGTNTPATTPTTPPDIPTQTPTLTPTPTDTPKPPTAIVNSPNGLYLRERPGGTQQIELIPNGAELLLLPGRETVDNLEWQQVRTLLGNEGWVAVEFIIFQ